MSFTESILYGSAEEISLWLQRGVTLDEIDEYGYTPLIEAVICNDVSKCKLVLNAGASIDFPDLTKRTALHWAADNSNLDICKLLLSYKANPNAYNTAGQPALVMPLLRGDKKIVELLCKQGADLKFAQDFIMAKLLGHRYELTGRVDIVDNKGTFVEVDYAGFYLEFTVLVILNSLERFKNNYGARHLRPWFNLLKDVIHVFKSASELLKYQRYFIDPSKHAQIIDKLVTQPLIMVPIAAEGHAVTLVKSGNLLIRCDRGEYGRDHGCVIVYEITRPEQWTTEFAKNLIYRFQSSKFINNELAIKLGLIEHWQIPMSLQITGNCSWANVEATIPALLFSILIQDKTKSWEQCHHAALYFYSEWRDWDKHITLHECMDNLAKASSARKAAKAAILGSILFQQCSYTKTKDMAEVEKILPLLLQQDYNYILKSYVKAYCQPPRTTAGENLVEILDLFGIDAKTYA